MAATDQSSRSPNDRSEENGSPLSPDDTFRLDDGPASFGPAPIHGARESRSQVDSHESRTQQLPDPSQLTPLDFDDLPPLPPAQRSVLSPEGLPAAQSPARPKGSSASISSLKSSPLLSTFRFDDSPCKGPAAHSQSPRSLMPQRDVKSSASGDDESSLIDGAVDRAARYVTVSAILSRSEVYYPPGSQHADVLKESLLSSGSVLPPDQRSSFEESPDSAPSAYRLRRRRPRKAPSNGSALEALGALLLHRDSAGRVSSLSLTKDSKDESSEVPSKRGVAQSWAHALNEISKLGPALTLTGKRPRGSEADGGHVRATIAERRAKKWGKLLLGHVQEAEGAAEGFRKVHSARSGLSFEVGRTSPHEEDTSVTTSNAVSLVTQQSGLSRPSTILLRAGGHPKLNGSPATKYGIGSSFHATDLPEAPPSPVDMPGAWHGGSAWRARPGEGFDEGALLLPPPLLDDQGSDAHSFEGLLGVRRMREQEKARKQMERLKARNRPTHKVGPLTALMNFVKAAHAAENHAKQAQQAQMKRPQGLTRSLSQPGGVVQADSDLNPDGRRRRLSRTETGPTPRTKISSSPPTGDIEAGADDDGQQEALSNQSTSAQHSPRQQPSRTPGAMAEVSADAAARLSASASPNLQAIPRRRQTSLSRRGSLVDVTGRQLNTVFEQGTFDPVAGLERRLSASPDLGAIASPFVRPSFGVELPSAPRLLPIQMSLPPSPFTPLGLDHRLQQQQHQPKEKRNSSSSSLASDYWSARPLNHAQAPDTPRLGPTILSIPPSPWTPHQGTEPVMYQLHFNTSSSSLRVPGTPRLVPTHIEVLPSPFPTPAASRRGSIGTDRSPATLGNGAVLAASQARSSASKPSRDASLMPSLSEDRSTHPERSTQDVDGAPPTSGPACRPSDIARTPKRDRVATDEAESARLTPLALLRDGLDSESWTPTVARPPGSESVHCDEAKNSGDRRSAAAPSSHGQSTPPANGRSFLIWFLVGDIGLRDRTSSGEILQNDVGGVAGIVVHFVGFVVFCLAHLVDLSYQVAEDVALAFWFFRWLLMNATGQTVLSRCILEAYRLIQVEWATVAEEDHEARGPKKHRSADGDAKARGLSRWQVVRGLFELFCLQSVTRKRYHEEGAGLVKFQGWSKRALGAPDHTTDSHGAGRLDIGAQKAAARAAILESSRYTAGEVSSDDDSGEPDDEDEDSSDDEMVVTNRGHDILEFSKTPRLDPVRPLQSRKYSGYFGSSYDAVVSPALRPSSASDAASQLKPLRESPRELVKTIKWASRLAISAYGLHVHIVELPPTFTPSGNRFSRQTFAYLSRLDAEDVLHADIQTLDVEANYSPTFYIVRDYVRKVVCVAVRGTQSFSDIIVDLEMQTEEIELPQVQPSPGEEFRCHAGIWRAAKALVSSDSKLFEKLRAALEENEDFGVIFCGHSLGGAIASAAALLLGEYRVPDSVDRDQGSWFTNMSSGLPSHRPIRAISFANPVTMTADLASRAAMGSIPLVTSVVLGSDIIPRAGHGQVREIRRMLGALSRVRRRLATSLHGEEDARVHIVRSWWDWRSISQASKPDDVLVHRKERIEEQLWSLRREVESELYAAVKRRHDDASDADEVSDRLSRARVPPSPWVGPQQREAAPLHQLAARRQALDAATLRSEAAQGGPLIPPGKCLWIENGDIYHITSPLSFFSLPEFRADMFATHFPAAYEEAILNLG